MPNRSDRSTPADSAFPKGTMIVSILGAVLALGLYLIFSGLS